MAVSTGRFGVQDSYLGQMTDPLSLNRYLYCLSDPLNLIDPGGHWGAKVKGVFADVFRNVIRRISAIILSGGEQIQAIAAEARGDYAEANRHRILAERYRALVLAFSCGAASYQAGWTYDRDKAIAYAKRYSDSMQGWGSGAEYVFGKLLGFGRNGRFPSYGANCANSVSQVMNAGGVPMTSEWHALARLIGNDLKNGKVATLDVTKTWAKASDQYEYSSNPLNGYTAGNVINIYGSQGYSVSGMNNVKFEDLSSNIESLGIQKGDLLYFYNAEEGVHYATVISKIDDQGIYYSANSNRRFDEPLKKRIRW